MWSKCHCVFTMTYSIQHGHIIFGAQLLNMCLQCVNCVYVLLNNMSTTPLFFCSMCPSTVFLWVCKGGIWRMCGTMP